jgi:hypothetical protein
VSYLLCQYLVFRLYINLRRKTSSFNHIIFQYRVTVKSASRFIGR